MPQLQAGGLAGHHTRFGVGEDRGDPNDPHPDNALPSLRFHDPRHLHATLLLQAGVPVHVVAARVGHADSAVTLRV